MMSDSASAKATISNKATMLPIEMTRNGERFSRDTMYQNFGSQKQHDIKTNDEVRSLQRSNEIQKLRQSTPELLPQKNQINAPKQTKDIERDF